MSANGEHQGDGVAPARVDRQALAQLHLALEHRLLAHRRALEHVAVVVDPRGEAGGRDLADPPTALDGAHPRRGDLLGLHDRAGERRAVGRVEHEAGAVLDALARAVGEEDLPRDRRGHAPDGTGHVEVGRQLADQRVTVGERVAGDLLEQRSERHELAERHPVHLVVAVDHLTRRVDEHRAVAERIRAGALDRADDDRRVELAGRARRRPRPTDRRRTAPSVSITSSGHTTRSTGGSTRSVASRWRSNTSITLASVLRVPCGPPPCTSATSAVPTA